MYFKITICQIYEIIRIRLKRVKEPQEQNLNV